ncbi:MAG: T9SS type A sorting domain-containing protein [candidate division WOR-3 bacterium]
MKKLCVLLLLVAIAIASNNYRRIQTVLPSLDDKIDNTRAVLNISRSDDNPQDRPIIGRQEVVGYTDYDWCFNGPNYKMCIVDPVANGIHVAWMYRQGSNPRNMRYNFYDFSTNTWNWPGTGVNVHTVSTGFGGMDNDPITGHAVITGHGTISGVLVPIVARDISPGAGLFEYSNPTFSSLWPPVGVTNNQMIHIAPTSNDPGGLRDTVYYMRMTAWNTWDAPYLIHDNATIPNFPTQNIAASKTSNKVVVLWECSEDPYPERAFYRLSTDGGANWGAITQIPFPPSYGGIVPGYHISSLYAIFDNNDNLRIVASVSDTGYTLPAQIWMYSPHLTNPWTLIHHYDADTLTAPVGYNAIFATRPTVAQAPNGNFVVAWEQFDSLNYEPTTNLARADIHVAVLTNNGQTVARKGRITDPNTTSKRFPSIGGVKNDTIILMYMIDSVAGSVVQSQGPLTNNPIVVHRLHMNSLPAAVDEYNPTPSYELALNKAQPNPFSNHTVIRYSLPTNTNIDLTIYDILGRPVKTLATGYVSAGSYTAIWNGRTDNNELAKPGIYFYTLKTANRQISQKIVKTN